MFQQTIGLLRRIEESFGAEPRDLPPIPDNADDILKAKKVFRDQILEDIPKVAGKVSTAGTLSYEMKTELLNALRGFVSTEKAAGHGVAGLEKFNRDFSGVISRLPERITAEADEPIAK